MIHDDQVLMFERAGTYYLNEIRHRFQRHLRSKTRWRTIAPSRGEPPATPDRLADFKDQVAVGSWYNSSPLPSSSSVATMISDEVSKGKRRL